MISILITIIIIIVIGGLLVWLLQQAPIDANIKQMGVWLMYAVIIIAIIFTILPLIHGGNGL